MNFRPLHDRVLVQPLDGEEKTAGGIIIPDTAKEKPIIAIFFGLISGFFDKYSSAPNASLATSLIIFSIGRPTLQSFIFRASKGCWSFGLAG